MEAVMNRCLFPALIAGAALSAAATPALALTCYEVIDRTNTVVYRDARTPVDLSAAGAPARDAMRDRGELLVIFDTSHCVVVGRATQTGSRKFTVDEIVAEWQSKWAPVSRPDATESSSY
jgi:hypothetical protein